MAETPQPWRGLYAGAKPSRAGCNNLAHAALRIYGNPDAKLSFCNSQAAEESDWIKFRPRLRMPAGKISIQISSDGKTTQTVWLNDVDVALEFDLAQKDGVEVTPSCWGVEIIVA